MNLPLQKGLQKTIYIPDSKIDKPLLETQNLCYKNIGQSLPMRRQMKNSFQFIKETDMRCFGDIFHTAFLS